MQESNADDSCKFIFILLKYTLHCKIRNPINFFRISYISFSNDIIYLRLVKKRVSDSLPFIQIGIFVPQYFPPGHSVGIKLPAGDSNLYHPGSKSWSQIGRAAGSDKVTWERWRLKLRFGWFLMILWLDGRHGSIFSFLISLDVIPPAKCN